jgi:hypothetical protein
MYKYDKLQMIIVTQKLSCKANYKRPLNDLVIWCTFQIKQCGLDLMFQDNK